ncbi:MAG: hypothetical protein ABI440_10250 [Casimicrobiaceae bacterium]
MTPLSIARRRTMVTLSVLTASAWGFSRTAAGQKTKAALADGTTAIVPPPLAFPVTASEVSGGLPDLKQVAAESRVKTIRYRDDTYIVTTAAGTALRFAEFNLLFKTDSTGRGPRKGEAVLVRHGMQGDRAQVVFSSASEIGTYLESERAAS